MKISIYLIAVLLGLALHVAGSPRGGRRSGGGGRSTWAGSRSSSSSSSSRFSNWSYCLLWMYSISFPALVSPSLKWLSPSFIRLSWPILAGPEVAWGNFGWPSRFLRGVARNLWTKSYLFGTWRLRRTSQKKQQSNFRNCFVALRTSLSAVIVFLADSALKI